jgi:transposase
MPPTRVKPYVKGGKKNDAVDAAACREGASRPSMTVAPIKTIEQQSALMRHRARQPLVEQRTRLGNASRAHLAEMGIVAARGRRGLAALPAMITPPPEDTPGDTNVPAAVRPVPRVLAEQRHGLAPRIAALERQIIAWHNSNPDSLATQPRFGPIVASAPDCRKRRGSHLWLTRDVSGFCSA